MLPIALLNKAKMSVFVFLSLENRLIIMTWHQKDPLLQQNLILYFSIAWNLFLKFNLEIPCYYGYKKCAMQRSSIMFVYPQLAVLSDAPSETTTMALWRVACVPIWSCRRDPRYTRSPPTPRPAIRTSAISLCPSQ